jgi:hypothetical protein
MDFFNTKKVKIYFNSKNSREFFDYALTIHVNFLISSGFVKILSLLLQNE